MGDGTYFVGMLIDPTNVVRETDESNNSLAMSTVSILVAGTEDYFAEGERATPAFVA